MSGVTSLRESFAAEIDEIDAALAAYLDPLTDPVGHYGMLRYHLGFADERFHPLPGGRQHGGKRVRAILCMLIGRAVGVGPGPIRQLMLASELLHSASLAHDDIQDAEPTRWGRPTLWSLCGTSQAINAGDALVGMTFDQLLKLREHVPVELVLQVLDRYVAAYLRMSEGQHLDLVHQGRLDLGVSTYLDVISRKTASALECFCGATAILAKRSPELEKSYRHFGASFGMLYQVADDCRAVWGDPTETGKIASRDIVLRKMTLPVLFAVERGPAPLRERILQSREAKPTFSDAEAAEIVEEMTAAGIDRLCTEVAFQHRDSALAALQSAPTSDEERMMLEKLVRMCATGLVARSRTGESE